MGEIARKIASLQSQMRTIDRNVPVSSEEPRFRVVDDANAHLLTLRMKEQELLEKYKEDNRLVVNVRKEIAILENFLKKEKQNQVPKIITGKNPVYDDAEREIVKAKGDLAALESRRSSLKVQMSLIERGLRELDARSTALSTLKRDVEVSEKNFQIYRERAEEARIADAMNRQKMANVSVIQEASVPTEPIKPRMGYNFMLALVIGSISGLGLAFFSEYAGQHLSTPQIAEKRLELPVLGSIENKG